jgi:hypothetical protein
MTTKMKNSGDAEKDQTRTKWLFVQTVSHAELVPNLSDKNTYTLTLCGGVENTIKFSDRPVRKAGHETTEEFVANWSKGSNSFAANPPNAELVIFNPGKEPSAVTLELTTPQWTADDLRKLSYNVTIVGDGALPVAAMKGGAALFIDDKTITSGMICATTGWWHTSSGRNKCNNYFTYGEVFPLKWGEIVNWDIGSQQGWPVLS